MNDQVCVGVCDSVEHIEKETKPGLDAKGAFLAISIDGPAIDMLEDEIWLARCRHPGVDEVCDPRMSQTREDRALPPKPLFTRSIDQRDVEKLDRRAPLEAPVAAFGEPDAAGPSLTDQRQ